ncbi:unnamed protein product [Phytophthora fragariaefolia]|uniref:Unnamed protein product n=1 Tax=Phytophthora fragariaefolia TaxID=1490495 RepID=A0A9W7CMR2_9STRA|nr:unnamed protein product [Phytophthora fragariaefolia]
MMSTTVKVVKRRRNFRLTNLTTKGGTSRRNPSVEKVGSNRARRTRVVNGAPATFARNRVTLRPTVPVEERAIQAGKRATTSVNEGPDVGKSGS